MRTSRGGVEAPDSTTALSGIKSKTKIADLFRNIKAFCKGCCTIGMLVNNCVTDNANLPLAASQGKYLMDQILSLNGRIQTGNNVQVWANDNQDSTYLQLLKRNDSTVQTALHLSHVKSDNSYRINNITNGKWDNERLIITDREMQVNLNIPDGADMNDFNKFGFFSGENLKNAPATGWFQFIVFPLNNNANYAIQFGFTLATGGHYYMRSKYDESWAGVSWKEFNISFKE